LVADPISYVREIRRRRKEGRNTLSPKPVPISEFSDEGRYRTCVLSEAVGRFLENIEDFVSAWHVVGYVV